MTKTRRGTQRAQRRQRNNQFLGTVINTDSRFWPVLLALRSLIFSGEAGSASRRDARCSNSVFCLLSSVSCLLYSVPSAGSGQASEFCILPLYATGLSNCPNQLIIQGLKRLSKPLPKLERNHLFVCNFSIERAII